jgi:hypothetical protein
VCVYNAHGISLCCSQHSHGFRTSSFFPYLISLAFYGTPENKEKIRDLSMHTHSFIFLKLLSTKPVIPISGV